MFAVLAVVSGDGKSHDACHSRALAVLKFAMKEPNRPLHHWRAALRICSRYRPNDWKIRLKNIGQSPLSTTE